MTQTLKDICRRKLKADKTYEARVETLREIGPKFGVNIYPKERDHKTQRNSVFVRECPKHGKEDVKMLAFLDRGNFGCPHCARELQSRQFK